MPAVPVIAIPKPLASPETIALGQLGSDYISNTTAYTGDWFAIECWTDCAFTTLTSSSVCVNGTAPGATAAVPMTKGQILRGRFSAITLASGSVIAYRASI